LCAAWLGNCWQCRLLAHACTYTDSEGMTSIHLPVAAAASLVTQQVQIAAPCAWHAIRAYDCWLCLWVPQSVADFAVAPLVYRPRPMQARVLKQYGELPEHIRINDTDVIFDGEDKENQEFFDFDEVCIQAVDQHRFWFCVSECWGGE
jgi:hypothetical protein